VKEAQDYLNRLGVSVDEVRQASLAEFGVRGTPTLLLVDDSGIVKNFWIGKIPLEQETDVLEALKGTDGNFNPPAGRNVQAQTIE